MTKVWTTLVEKIHLGVNPYEGFPVDQWPPNPHGWESDHHWFREAVDTLRPEVVVEVGSFLGASGRHFATCLKDAGLDAAVICIDTFLAEMVLWTNMMWRPTLLHRYGRPEFYNTFMTNTIKAGLQEYIVPLPMASTAAATYLSHLSISSNVIYIDGNHQEGEAYRDLDLYYNKILEPGGVMIVDDYVPEDGMFHGLIKDFDGFTLERHLHKEFSGRKARIFKPKGRP